MTPKTKDTLSVSILFALCLIVFLLCSWHGMNKELCNRGYTQAQYNEMKLDCNQYRKDN